MTREEAAEELRFLKAKLPEGSALRLREAIDLFTRGPTELESLPAPVEKLFGAFLRERCDVEAEAVVSARDLCVAWRHFHGRSEELTSRELELFVAQFQSLEISVRGVRYMEHRYEDDAFSDGFRGITLKNRAFEDLFRWRIGLPRRLRGADLNAMTIDERQAFSAAARDAEAAA